MLGRANMFERLAARHYAETVRWSRQPVFFVRFGVADTPDGRFDLLLLHALAVLDRLTACDRENAEGGYSARAFADTLFLGFEDALHEQGAGDLGMVKAMKRFSDAYLGRRLAYAQAADAAALQTVLLHNLYRCEPAAAGPEMAANARAMADYVLNMRKKLSEWDPKGDPLDFGPIPG